MCKFSVSHLAVVCVVCDVFPDGQWFQWVTFFPARTLGEKCDSRIVQVVTVTT